MVLSLIHRRDWKDYSVYKKGFILLLFSIFPYRTWKWFSTSVIKSLELTNVNVCNDKALLDFIFELKYKRCSHLLMTFREMINIFRMIKKTENLNGDIAEVGVFRGGSAAIMAHFKGNRHLHLFDTFEGLPDVNKDKDLLAKGEMSNAPEQLVRDLLKDYQNWHIYKGIFPGTSEPIKNKVFSFVHLDVDLYEGTLFSLQFFYPRMQKGGIILVHDYSDLLTPGVKDALKEFFADKSESIIEIWDTHAGIVKQ
jgi:O-methyltransferase